VGGLVTLSFFFNSIILGFWRAGVYVGGQLASLQQRLPLELKVLSEFMEQLRMK
jgi:hypothetical protein